MRIVNNSSSDSVASVFLWFLFLYPVDYFLRIDIDT